MKFIWTGDGALRHDGEIYETGDEVEMTEKQAAAQGLLGRLEKVHGKSSKTSSKKKEDDKGDE